VRISPAVHWASMALAVTSTTALAQESSTQIYGTLNVDVERVEAGGTVPPRNRVTQNSSNLGFRGEEKIGGGLAAIWQIESGVAVDAGGSSIASRNTAVGLKGGWGSLRLGQWDTPYKVIFFAPRNLLFWRFGNYSAMRLSGNHPPLQLVPCSS